MTCTPSGPRRGPASVSDADRAFPWLVQCLAMGSLVLSVGACGGGGGGGSGGMIWLRSEADVVISSHARLSVDGGMAGGTCGDQSGGAGAVGLIQIEDQDGLANTGFHGAITGGRNVIVAPIFTGPRLDGQATSRWHDARHPLPDWFLPPVPSVSDPGNIPGGIANVEYQAAHANGTGTGPDITTVTPFVPGHEIDTLDGHRFLRWRATLSILTNAALPLNAIGPSISRIAIGRRIPNHDP